ncbi:hypothetical protein STEG23_032878 [Scotinomys teguina]
MKVKAAAPCCQLFLILLMTAVMLLPGTKCLLLLVQRTVTRTIVVQETIGKDQFGKVWRGYPKFLLMFGCGFLHLLLSVTG